MVYSNAVYFASQFDELINKKTSSIFVKQQLQKNETTSKNYDDLNKIRN